MADWLEKETEALRRSWDRHAAGDLRDYLVASVEDPRLNVASILSRHFLVELLFGNRFADLQQEELRFSLAMNWLLQRFEHPLVEDDLAALRQALQQPLRQVEGVTVPLYLHHIYTSLPRMAEGLEVPNYLETLLQPELLNSIPVRLPETVLNTFARLWHRLLARRRPRRLSVLEPACGSANDFRFWPDFGLARLIEYHGFDLCEKNVANARTLCPGVDFRAGNLLTWEAEDGAYDVVVVHDLFEHLSPAALEVALTQVCRLARRALSLGFFQMHEETEHLVRPVDDYHWNKLSLPRVRTRLERAGFATQAIHIGTFLEQKFGCADTHNPDAYVLRAWRE